MRRIIKLRIRIRFRRSALVMFTIAVCVLVLVRCMNNGNIKEDDLTAVGFEDFAGSEKCAGCHKNIFDSHIQTAHYRTLQPPEEKFIMGSFEKGKNSFSYSPDIKLVMEKRDSGFYQVVYFKGKEKKAMRFDMVIGSGVMGQSFLSWRNNKLFQLPITFFTAANQWSNSPGLRSDKVVIDKPVTSRCLECHASYAEGISGPPLEPMDFNHNRIIYGINCEKCHGPAAKHVEYQTQNPLEKTGKFIVNPALLSRQLQLDVCALCHGGNIKKTRPSFQFTAGKNLADYFVIDSMNEEVARNGNIDVHGNNVGLLKASKCFRRSVNLTCNTCHNTHENQRGKTELFSQKCMGCHDVKAENFKTSTHAQVIGIEKNCIDCHMPAQASKSIAVKLQGEEVLRASLIRTHFIGIYAEETKKIRALKNDK